MNRILVLSACFVLTQQSPDESTTTTTTTTTSSSSSESSFDCYWLRNPANLTVSSSPVEYFQYNGTCCTPIAVKALNSSYQWMWSLQISEPSSKWNVLSNYLFCVEGACSEPSLWTNCSGVSTSSSSSTSTLSTTTTEQGSSSSSTPSTSSESPESSSTDASTSSSSLGTSSSESTKITLRSTEGSSTESSETSTVIPTSSESTTRESKDEKDVSSSTSSEPSASTSSSATSSSDSSSKSEESSISRTSSSSVTSSNSEESTTSESSTSSGSSEATEVSSSSSSTSSDSPTSSKSTETSNFTSSSSESSTSSADYSSSGASTKATEATGVSTASTDSSSHATSTPSTSSGASGATSESVGSTSNTTSGATGSTTTQMTSTMSSEDPTTTTFYWPTGGTTRILSSGEIILSEVLTEYTNCTTVLWQLIRNPTTNTTRVEVTEDPEGCKATTSTSSGSQGTGGSTTPMTTATSTSEDPTTTFNWPTGGTTRILSSGEIIISEVLKTYPNCTTILYQLIRNPTTNATRTEVTSDAEGCKASSLTSGASGASTTPMSTATSTSEDPTTTFYWPTGGTTRVLPSGEIIISEVLQTFPNCTTTLKQLIWNPSTNTTRTEVTSDAEGCKASTSAATGTTPLPTTTFNWPTGGTTRILPSGEIIISEVLQTFPNCTTILEQLILNPTTNTTRTEVTSDAEGCKTTTTSSVGPTSPEGSTTPMPSGATEATQQTTTFQWPTGGTTKILPSGEIIISESLITYTNCTTVLMQLIWNPVTNATRTEVTSDAEGCKASSSTSGASGASTTPMSSSTSTSEDPTTTFNWPTGGTTRVLPSGEIIISEVLQTFPNCTTILKQLIWNPSTNTTRTEVTSDAEGCMSSTSGASGASGASTTPMSTATSTSEDPTTTFNWPTGGTTRTLPSGEIIISEVLQTFPNCTTTLKQLIWNPSTNTTRTEVTSDAEGCKASTSSESSTTSGATVTCPFPPINLNYTTRPTKDEQKEYYQVGHRLVHLCQKRYVFEVAKQPFKTHDCLPSGAWSGYYESCVADKVASRVKREL